ncbi:MAG: aldo/keto reductase [Acidobacteria bacterium]|nr:aldo/keto reductase [Acidobacteriota bacterium]
MRRRPLGQSGIEASVIGLGTWAIGGWMWGGTESNQSIQAIHAAIDAGINLIDTAPAYGLGLSEKIVGEAIRDRRDRVVLATKCGLQWHSEEGTPFFRQDGRQVYKFLGAQSIRRELEASLLRLGTDYIDLYQTHWQDEKTPVAETLGVLLDLQREGKIRAIGASNATVAHLSAYCAAGDLDCDQEKFSMLDRRAEESLLPFAEDHQLAFLAYSPLALGLLTGKIAPDRQFPPDDLRATNPRFTPEYRQGVLEVLERMKPIADDHRISVGQLVLAWTIAVPGVTHALAGARNPAQARENAAAAAVKLSNHELATLTALVDEFPPSPVRAIR